MEKKTVYILLNIILFIFSFCGVLSKLASRERMFSLRFCLFYLASLFIMGLYAVFWQQILKYVPLSTAYANRAVTVVWGSFWGVLFFGEHLTPGKIAGIIIIISGIILYAVDIDKGKDDQDMRK